MNRGFCFWLEEGNAVDAESGIETKGIMLGTRCVCSKNRLDVLAKMNDTIHNVCEEQNYNLLILTNNECDALLILDDENNYTQKEFKKITKHIIKKLQELEACRCGEKI